MPTEKLVKDLMRPLDQYYYVKEEETVQEALRFMNKARKENKPSCLIVVGKEPSEKEIIKGFVTPFELVFGIAGHFLKGAQRSGPIFWEGQLEAECLEGSKKQVGEIMVPIKACARETEMLMEAVFLLNKYQMDFLPVVKKDDVVGIIHLEDILKEISRIVLKK
ncbi:MAG: CBS domain-containing protein [Deltaproteobacteria bacterium]|nr:CBS domain-containing protein [Deltaproteobacteria bacterium]MBW2019074.1 CBS domain-containing protein [Deltaproteobacteria bacterium]MBW2073535.1 CBS domain-containing protein [Deltaproteobacteria bacterium]